jgi:hypothetical protein
MSLFEKMQYVRFLTIQYFIFSGYKAKHVFENTIFALEIYLI